MVCESISANYNGFKLIHVPMGEVFIVLSKYMYISFPKDFLM